MQHKYTFLLIAACLAATITFAQPGTLDNSFAGNGLLRTLLGTTCSAAGVKTQSDGKIVVAGSYTTAQSRANLLVERYNTDGSFDNSFAGGDGEQGVDLGGNAEADAVAIQSDGKIVAAGSVTSSDNSTRFAAVRLNANGTMDNSFGTGGKIVIQNLLADDKICVALQSDGKILLAGPTWNSNGTSLTIVRLKSNGSLDPTFGTNGIQTITVTPNCYTINVSMLVQPDGKIDLCCTLYFASAQNDHSQAAIVRVNANGTPDPGFGTNGVVLQAIGGVPYTGATSIALQTDNKIVAGGSYGNSNAGKFLVMRFNTSGTPDNSFAGNGRAGISFAHPAGVTGLAIESSGTIIACGRTWSSTDGDFAMVRLLTDGTPDANFGNDGNGKVTTGFGYYDEANAVALEPNGKIVVAGLSGNDIALARYLVAVKTPTNRSMPTATAVDSLQGRRSLAIYPNPAGSFLVLDGLDPKVMTQYNITDVSGKTVHSSSVTFSASTQINTGNLLPGTYFIRVSANGKVHTLQFVKR